MNLFERFRRWRRQWRWRQASKNPKAELREFVYLDEVSVYSLIASKLGGIAAEFTETQTASLQGELGSSLGAVTGIMNADVNSSLLTSQTHGSQVLRKSIVQTTFKELYELEAKTLPLKPIAEEAEPPQIKSVKELVALTRKSTNEGWIVDPEKLSRGQLFELEVQLEAEAVFRVSAVFSSLWDILQAHPTMVGANIYEQFLEINSVNRILEKLLAGLVPIRGQVTSYDIMELDGKEWLVHRRLTRGIPDSSLPTRRLLYVVGVAEQSLFWKDIRRVLFSRAPFRVLCRLAQDGLQQSWTPVKLAHVLDAVAPSLTNQINALGSTALATMAQANRPEQGLRREQDLMYQALIQYAALLADHYGYSASLQESLTDVYAIAAQYCTSFRSVTERRDAFDAIAGFLLERFEIERDPLVVAQLRAVALADAGLNLTGQDLSLTPSNVNASSPLPDERFLDSEFVAIYW